MTCREIRHLIHALPGAEWPRRERQKAEEHGRDCPRCRWELTAADGLEASLSGLAEPEPPAGLAARIMAETAGVDQERLAKERAEAAASLRLSGTTHGRGDTLAWLGALAGIAIGFGWYVYGVITGAAPASSRLAGWGSRLQLPDGGVPSLFLAFGLLLYLASFLAPFVRRQETKDP